MTTTLSLAAAEDDPDQFPLRMRDLVRQTGVPVGTLHFYAASGLLPEARKLARTSVRYPTMTVERVRWIRRVQHELRLPLRAIRWVLDELGQVPVSEIQTRMTLGDLLDRSIRQDDRPASVALSPTLVGEMEDIGLVTRTSGATRSPSDERLLEIISAMRSAGFSQENGFSNDQLLLYRDAMRDLVRKETRRIIDAGSRLGPQEATHLVERGLPAIDELVRFFHLRAIIESIEMWRELTHEEQAG